ncbi:MAG: hypothetical protein AAGA54_28055, partial [Myxococcota bacterium]
MTRLHAVLAAVLLWWLPSMVHATVGGDEPLRVLGYAPADARIYFERDVYGDGLGLPQLYYVPLTGPNAGRTIEVKSWYRAVESAEDIDAAVVAFNAKRARLQRRLKPVKQIAPTRSAKVSVKETAPVKEPWVEAWSTRYELDVAVRGAGTRTVTAYDPDVEIVAELRVPGQARAVLLVRYFSWAFEHGYTRDLAMSIPLTQAQVDAYPRLRPIEYELYG